MYEEEIGEILAKNIKKYRKGIFTQESLAEQAGLSVQLINGIEGGRKWVSRESLAKIATALNVEVYQLFIPQNITNIDITPTPENENIRAQIQKQVVENVKKALLKELNKLEK